MRGGLATSGESGRDRIESPAPAIRFAAPEADDYLVAAYEAHWHEVFSFLARTTRDDAEAEELLQVAFLWLGREAGAGRFPVDVRAWLFGVASRLAMGGFRRRSVVDRWLERFGRAKHRGPRAASPGAWATGRERVAEMEHAVRGLADDERLALLLASSGFSGREVAQAIGRTEAATRTMISRTRVHVLAELAEAEG